MWFGNHIWYFPFLICSKSENLLIFYYVIFHYITDKNIRWFVPRTFSPSNIFCSALLRYRHGSEKIISHHSYFILYWNFGLIWNRRVTRIFKDDEVCSLFKWTLDNSWIPKLKTYISDMMVHKMYNVGFFNYQYQQTAGSCNK